MKVQSILERRRQLLDILEKAAPGPQSEGDLSQLRRLDSELDRECQNWRKLSGKTEGSQQELSKASIQGMVGHSAVLQERLTIRNIEAELNMIKSKVKGNVHLSRQLASLCVLDHKVGQADRNEIEILRTEIRKKMKNVEKF